MSYYVDVWLSDGEVFYGKRPSRICVGARPFMRGPIKLIYRIRVTPE